jgi:uncharacterized protein with PIN domain
MAMSQFFTLKEVKLSNNCPECYSNTGLILTFKQELKETLFYKAITKETKTEIYCSSCNTPIFPISWSDAIDRVVAYHYRALQLKPKSLRLKRIAWAILIFDVVLLAVIVLVAIGIISI